MVHLDGPPKGHPLAMLKGKVAIALLLPDMNPVVLFEASGVDVGHNAGVFEELDGGGGQGDGALAGRQRQGRRVQGGRLGGLPQVDYCYFVAVLQGRAEVGAIREGVGEG